MSLDQNLDHTVKSDKNGVRVIADEATDGTLAQVVELVVKATDDSTFKPLSHELDDNGKAVLRVVDAAPFAYDQVANAIRTLPVRKLVRTRNTYSTTVAATSGNHILTFVPTAGHIARLRYMAVFIPVIAGSTGSHRLQITVGPESAYAAERIIDRDVVATSAITVSANNATDRDLMRDVVFDATNPLQVAYYNVSNIDQTGVRFVLVIYEEEAVV